MTDKPALVEQVPPAMAERDVLETIYRANAALARQPDAARVAELEAFVRDVAKWEGDGGPGTPWRSIVRQIGENARALLGVTK